MSDALTIPAFHAPKAAALATLLTICAVFLAVHLFARLWPRVGRAGER